MFEQSEQSRLENIAQNSLYAEGPAPQAMRYCFQVFQRHLTGDSILELGPAEGLMTQLFAATGKRLTLVDGSESFCSSLRLRFPQATVIQALFESYEPRERFHNVILGHVLEHVADPVDILRRAGSWLRPDGRLFAAVPNAHSLHRQAAVLMGLLPREDALNEMDLHHGHRRVFTPESLHAAALQAGLVLEHSGGYWLKTVSNKQISESWTPAMLDAYLQLGERYPEVAGEIYFLARLP